MKRVLITSLFLVLAASGCDKNEKKEAEQAAPANAPANDKPVAADNTDKNERDRGGETLTPGDQGSSEADRTITQEIRQGVVKNDALSMTGKNVKIITVDGVVTLRGPVKTADEKANISAIASKAEGVKRVDNQLEVAAN